MATKSEIWEAKKLIKSGVEDIMEHLQRKTNWASRAVILRAFEGIKRTISPIITHIIDNDDYTTAVEINSIITPVFDGYFGNEPSEADFDREPEKNILRAENRSAYDFRDLVMDLRNWISEYEKQIHETKEARQTNDEVYKYKDKAMDAAFDFFVKSDVLNAKNVTKADFLKAVESADFKKVREDAKTKKTYLDYSLSILKIFVEQSDDWYRAAAASIGKKPKNLTQNKTQNIDEFGEELNKILKKFVW